MMIRLLQNIQYPFTLWSSIKQPSGIIVKCTGTHAPLLLVMEEKTMHHWYGSYYNAQYITVILTASTKPNLKPNPTNPYRTNPNPKPTTKFGMPAYFSTTSLRLVAVGKSSESVQCAITGPCLCMRHRPSAWRTVPIRKICLAVCELVNLTPTLTLVVVCRVEYRKVKNGRINKHQNDLSSLTYYTSQCEQAASTNDSQLPAVSVFTGLGQAAALAIHQQLANT